MDMISRFTEVLKAVTVDCKDDGTRFTDRTRIDVIKSLLEGSEYQLLVEGDLCLIYGKKSLSADAVIVSSHIDCVYSKCYCEEIGDLYRGTFDNSLTNAAVLCDMIDGKFADNVYVAFTGDEEVNSNGAHEVLEHLENSGISPRFVLVTDVTNEGWDEEAVFSIENDKGFDLEDNPRLVDVIKNCGVISTYIHDAEPDESWDYAMAGCAAMSMCAPVLGDMHDDFGSVARKREMPQYCSILAQIVNAV
jgi:hypothetical protein